MEVPPKVLFLLGYQVTKACGLSEVIVSPHGCDLWCSALNGSLREVVQRLQQQRCSRGQGRTCPGRRQSRQIPSLTGTLFTMFTENLTIRSEDFNMKLTIFAEESERYLCFTPKWKLVGSKKFRGTRCQFYEEMVPNGYNRYRSVANESHFVGFNKRGKPLRGKQVLTPGFEKCFNFLKIGADFSIREHNQYLSKGHRQSPVNLNKHNPFQHRLRHSKNRHKNFKELS